MSSLCVILLHLKGLLSSTKAGFYPSLLRVEHSKDIFAKTHGGAVPKDDAPTKLRFFDRVKGILCRFSKSSILLMDKTLQALLLHIIEGLVCMRLWVTAVPNSIVFSSNTTANSV